MAKIAIVGCGAMGSVYAALMVDAGHEVHGVTLWPDHAEAMATKGLRCEGASGDRTVPIHASTTTDGIGPCDLVIIATKAFDVEAKANRVFPVGGGLWSILQPQYAPRNPATEFHYTQDVVGVPEFAGPKIGASSNVVSMEVDLKPDSSGVLYALGAFSGGLALWVDKGKLSYEYNLFEVQRTRIETREPLPTGKVKIEVESRLSEQRRAAPMEVVIRVNGQEVAKGRVPVTASLAFTANDAFDIGMDSYSPVSLAYFDRAPFRLNGKIDKVLIRYLKEHT